MKNLYICLLMGLCCMAAACSDDEDATPSMADTDRLEALVDNSNADIAEFKTKYGTYILYNFDDLLDFAYQFEEGAAWREAVVTKLDAADVPEAVSFLKENFLNCYDESVYADYFPRKLLLCSQVKGGTLGVSAGDASGCHDAVANMNSMTIARLDHVSLAALTGSAKTDYLRYLHFIFLGGYVVNARSIYYADDTFFEYSKTFYTSLMDGNRTQAKDLPDSFFYEKGFFRPTNETDTYFGTAEEDLVAFTRQFALMDEEMSQTIRQYDMLDRKMRLVVQSLKAMGVKVERINPLAAAFLD